MSLVLDTLKKIKGGGTKGAVPPSMMNLAPEKGSRKPSKVLILLLVLVCIGSGLVFYAEIKMNDAPIVKKQYRKPKVQKPVQAAKPQLPPSMKAPSKVASAPIQAQNQTALPKDLAQAKPVPVQEQVSESDIQKRIEDAVKAAVAKTKAELTNKIENVTDANRQRAASVSMLPVPANKKPRAVEVARARPVERASTKPIERNITKPVTEKSAIPESAKAALAMQSIKNAQNITASVIDSGQLPESGEAQMIAESEAAAAPVVEQRPVMTPEQREAFEKRIDYNTKLTLASRAAKKGDFAKAAGYYRETMELKQSKNNLISLVKSEVRAGNFEAVGSIFDKYKDMADQGVVAQTALDMANMGFQMKALELLRSSISKYEKTGQLFYSAGIIQEGRGELLRAEKAYEKAVNANPADAYFVYAYARILDIGKKYKEAVEQYRRVVRLPAGDTMKQNSVARIASLVQYLESIAKQKEESKSDKPIVEKS
jgi:tetratricopeptide (TPR) repeat protein